MFKWKSSDRPSTPKLSSIALPETLSPVTRSITPPKIPAYEKPAKSVFNRFRPSPPIENLKPHKISSPQDMSNRPRGGSLSTRDDDDDYDPDRIWKRTKVHIVKSKAAIEEEQEREEERLKIEEMKRMEEMKRQAEAAKRAVTPKSILKNGSMYKKAKNGSMYKKAKNGSMYKKAAASQQEFPSYQPPAQDLRRHNSVASNYYSDSEPRKSHRHSHRISAQQQQPALEYQNSYPFDSQTNPQYPPQAQHHLQPRSRHGSISEPQPMKTTPPRPNTGKYVKALRREDLVAMKPRAITLSWPLVDYEVRRGAGYPNLWFDAAFDPRLLGYEVKVWRDGRAVPITPREEGEFVSPHEFMLEMTIWNKKLHKWPIKVFNDCGIRCVDVFRAIYDTYAVPLTRQELIEWGQEYIDSCQRAFQHRCDEGPQLPPVTKSRGMCRIDLLRGEKIFKGLTQMSGPGIGPNTWELHFQKHIMVPRRG